MAVCKQYTEHEGAWWYEWVVLYEDGVEIKKEKVVLDLDLDEYIETIEKQGYVKAYTDKDIESIEQEIANLQKRRAFMYEHRLIKKMNNEE